MTSGPSGGSRSAWSWRPARWWRQFPGSSSGEVRGLPDRSHLPSNLARPSPFAERMHLQPHLAPPGAELERTCAARQMEVPVTAPRLACQLSPASHHEPTPEALVERLLSRQVKP